MIQKVVGAKGGRKERRETEGEKEFPSRQALSDW